jgi:hypothetical protein
MYAAQARDQPVAAAWLRLKQPPVQRCAREWLRHTALQVVRRSGLSQESDWPNENHRSTTSGARMLHLQAAGQDRPWRVSPIAPRPLPRFGVSSEKARVPARGLAVRRAARNWHDRPAQALPVRNHSIWPGLVFLVIGGRLVSATENALINTLELPLAVAWVWVCFNEMPTGSSLVGGIIVMAAVAAHVWYSSRSQIVPATG